MNKLYFISLLLFATTLHVFAQDRGISYQAVAIDADGKQIPGYDVYGNPITDAEISVRFGLYDNNDMLEYEETHQTLTDQYGLFNLVIGEGISNNNGLYSYFEDIVWSMDKKFLKVELDVDGGSDYKLMSYQELLSVPFAKFAENSLNPGPTGVSVVNSYIDSYGNLTLVLSDSTELNAGGIIGPPGISVDSAYMHGTTSPYHLIIEYSSGDNDTLFNVFLQGPAGTQGQIGATGSTGANGVDGAQGPIGDTGLQGIQGVQGEQGIAGNDGANGVDGAVGATGPPGISGNDGANGVDGAQGETGAQGPIGDTGLQGIQGIQGETGGQGEQGIAGNDGANGTNGTNGLDGAQGIQGIQGLIGNTIWQQDSQNNISYINGNVNIGSSIIDNSAVLTINSQTQGVILPSMNENQRDAIFNPTTGLLIFQNDGIAGFYYYDGNAWTLIGAAEFDPTLIYTTDGF